MDLFSICNFAETDIFLRYFLYNHTYVELQLIQAQDISTAI